ncbi:hypothetical protein XO10_07380 [Marinitoga sp. 1135]|uniref:ABC-type molybdate transport system, periplasmic component n=1 Tax=Marinitoga piezophila (strain DSM 14283 / JCM 11233 / KA3) TaxID=443254 RepID=H2J475_MARPK|nr:MULTISPECIES: extracellular solute-binding protein [Marinitoga]AEX85890.1 ABC-type molybdate transport system, periplasmic component [Marinitoga piezophila KA3]NUU96096.1 hypothetical protein [Marinitoga sp. 1135]NUU98003.1 hypothetical protein [Marinitoga sp. 1138]
MKKVLFLFVILFTVSIMMAEELVIFHAGSLTNVLNAVAREFEKENPGVKVKLMGSGSLVVARKITELGQRADLAFVADYTIIPKFFFDKYADYNVVFSSNSMIIAYNDKSKYSKEINEKNWYEILFKNGVKFGHSNPDLDPCGYRTLMTMQLAEKYYNLPGIYDKFLKTKNRMVLKKSIDLIAYLEANEMDYAFLYKSEAFQHNLKYIELPEEIDLSSLKYEENYKTAFVEVPGKSGKKIKIYGKPINYGFTLLKNAPHRNLAIEFVKFMYSEKGKEIFKNMGMELFANVDRPKNLPEEFKELWGY